jgi:hypothetical protein
MYPKSFFGDFPVRKNTCVCLVYVFLLLVFGQQARAETLKFSRLEIPVPKNWTLVPLDNKAKSKATSRDLTPTDYKGKAILRIFAANRFKGESLQDKLANVVAIINENRQVLKTMPSMTKSTQEGFPVVVRGEVTKGAKGDSRTTISFGVATGSTMQVITFIALTSTVFRALLPNVVKAVERVKVRFPIAKTKLEGVLGATKKYQFFNCTLTLPNILIKSDADFIHSRKFLLNASVKGRKKPVPLTVLMSFYGSIAGDAKAVLSAWLLGSDFDLYGNKKNQSQVLKLEDWTQQSGQRMTVLSLKTYRGKTTASYRYGVLIYGRGWTLCLGVAMGEGRAYNRLSEAQKQELFKYYNKRAARIIWTLAHSVKWSKEAIKIRADLQKQLIKKKKFYYNYYSSSTIMNTNLEKYHYWTFYPEGHCDYRSNTNIFIASGAHKKGLVGFVTPKSHKKAVFQVVEWNKTNYLLVLGNKFFTTLYLLEMNKSGSFGKYKYSGLAIAGRIEGKYRRFNGDKSRFPPP